MRAEGSLSSQIRCYFSKADSLPEGQISRAQPVRLCQALLWRLNLHSEKQQTSEEKPKTGLPEIAESGRAPLLHAVSPASLHLCGFLFLLITKHSHFTEFLQRHFSFHSFLPKTFLSNSVTLPYLSWKDTIYDSIFEYLLKHVYCPKLKRNRPITPQVGLLSFLWCCSHEKSHLEGDLEKVCLTSYFFFIFKSQSY